MEVPTNLYSLLSYMALKHGTNTDLKKVPRDRENWSISCLQSSVYIVTFLGIKNRNEKDKHSTYTIAQCSVLNHENFAHNVCFLIHSQRGSHASVSFQITSEVQSGRSPRLSFSSGCLTPATYDNSNIAIYEVGYSTAI